jgi:amino acid adenylation domain-containing protein
VTAAGGSRTGPPGVLQALLESAADAFPDRPAVVDRDRTLRYEELEAGANRLATLLVDTGVQRGDRVGLYLEKSLESLVAAYGVMKAGAAYVPLDPAAPAARLGFIAANCGLRVLATGVEKADRWGALVDAGAPLESVVVLNGEAGTPRGVRSIGRRDLEARDDARPGTETTEHDLAYILYTSGSTGPPKGVMLTHRNALTFVEWAAASVGVTPEDRLSSHAPLHFDLSVFDLYAASRGGASVTLVPSEATVLPRELARFIDGAGITVWYSVPSVLTALTLRGGLPPAALPGLRTVIFAGEVFPSKFLRRLMELLPHADFYNWYGPTETNVCTWFRVREPPRGLDDPIPIGRAIDGVQVFAVTEDGRRAKRGEVGELYVQGPSVTPGYWDDPERTAAVLVPSVVGPRRETAYRTGDLVEELPDGNYRFLGRRDAQIKSRGHRIELGEIEVAILAHPQVVECAVVAIPDEEVTNRIRAHVVTTEPLGQRDLVHHCRGRLPKYMIPEVFDFADSLPKTATGKVDRQALISA